MIQIILSPLFQIFAGVRNSIKFRRSKAVVALSVFLCLLIFLLTPKRAFVLEELPNELAFVDPDHCKSMPSLKSCGPSELIHFAQVTTQTYFYFFFILVYIEILEVVPRRTEFTMITFNQYLHWILLLLPNLPLESSLFQIFFFTFSPRVTFIPEFTPSAL